MLTFLVRFDTTCVSVKNDEDYLKSSYFARQFIRTYLIVYLTRVNYKILDREDYFTRRWKADEILTEYDKN